MKPVIRWTIGGLSTKAGYRILFASIEKILHLYGNEFDYFVCYNDVDTLEIEKLKIKYGNVNFLKQKWEDCPLNLVKPEKQDIYKQKLNGTFWKICPPRLRLESHEIILDNDLVFLKRPKIIEKFLKENKNLIVQDCMKYTANYHLEDEQGYNSGVIGLCPNYDFSKELIQNWDNSKNKKHFNYDEEQGFLTYVLLKTNPLIGKSEDFSGIFNDYMFINSIDDEICKRHNIKKVRSDRSANIVLNKDLLCDIFKKTEVVHFLTANRNQHRSWEYFKNLLFKKTL